MILNILNKHNLFIINLNKEDINIDSQIKLNKENDNLNLNINECSKLII